MRVIEVPELIDCSDGFVPEAFKGTLTQVYEQRQVGQDGNLMQKGTLAGGGKTMVIVFMGREDMTNTKGCEIYVTATKGPRGFSGVKRKDNDYRGKITPEVWVYSGADISINDDGGGRRDDYDRGHPDNRRQDYHEHRQEPPRDDRGSEPPDRRTQNRGGSQEAGGGKQKPSPLTVEANKLAAGKKTIVQYMNLMVLSYRAAALAVEEVKRQNPEAGSETGWLEPDAISKFAMSFFIQGTRDKVHGQMPLRHVAELEKELAAARNNRQQ